MTENQLKYFVTIVDTGSYLKASLELNISQSSISKQIQALEHELGVQLFNRQHKRIKLSDEGKQLLLQVRNLLDEINHLKYTAEKLQIGYKNKITVATLPFMSYFGLYEPISRFKQKNPSFQIDIIELEEPQLFYRLSNNNFDILLTYWHEQNLANCKKSFLPISMDEIVLAVHKDSTLAKLDYITTEHLKNTPLLLMESYTCIANLCKVFFEQHAIVPEIILRGRPETIFGGVEAKQGAALITRKQASSYSSNNVILIPVSPSITAIPGAVINKYYENNSKVNELINMLIASNE